MYSNKEYTDAKKLTDARNKLLRDIEAYKADENLIDRVIGNHSVLYWGLVSVLILFILLYIRS